ncbi:hypothetical protein TTHERM_00933210 (macronuclear) [Tetrahymena thermophila SB210]|uniref:Uncharacterized protein n=1 Tax=Tetrahymena thermophila (strain SB210) TaxID=312017 RepID=I7M9G6_TETTS|nr:hypothetical protein TTHERM_00933210 [Tetrahymena thermophila SB210]EAS01632.2 hypothetical protein TTHERM_00933210 [Tetrahymena thermophila SB210]|eukprot:XP_001021877.2 hypothetical protein TTHERM_00933210 [Tetrahymena thermophila SB210]
MSIEQYKQQANYSYQKKSPLPLQNVTQQIQNTIRIKENFESPISSSSNYQFSTKSRQKSENCSQGNVNQVLSSQEIVSKYNMYLCSTKSANRESLNSFTKRNNFLNKETLQDSLSTKLTDSCNVNPLLSQNFSNSKSPARSLLGENAQIERTKSEDKIASNKIFLQSSKSTAAIAFPQQQDFKIEHESNNSTNEFKLQLIRKLGELEIELKKESIKNQNLEYDNKNLRTTIHKLQDQFKSQSKDNLDLRKTIDSLNKEIAQYIKIQKEEQQLEMQEKRLQQIFEKTEIEQKLSNECDRLTSIIEDKESQIAKWMEKFMNLKEIKQKELSSPKSSKVEQQLNVLREQVSIDQNELFQLKQQNNQLQNQLEETGKEKDKLKLNNQMLMEQIRQNSQIIHSQQQKLQDLDGQNKNSEKNKKVYEQRLEEIQKIKEDLELKQIELEKINEDLVYQNRELKNLQQKGEKQNQIQKQKYEERISEYQQVLQDLKKQIDDLNQKNIELKNSLKIKCEEQNNTKDQISQFKEQIKILSEDLNEKNDKLIQISKKESSEKMKQFGFTQSAEVEQLRLKTRLQELEQELQAQRCDYDRLITKISEIQKQNDDLLNQLQSQQKSHKVQLEELEKNYQQLTQTQIDREVKKVVLESERNKFFSENQQKLTEKQIQAYKEKIQEMEGEIQNYQNKLQNEIQKEQLASSRKQIDKLLEEKETLIQKEEETKKLKKLNEELQIQVRNQQNILNLAKEKEDENKRQTEQQFNDLRKQIEILHLESRNKQIAQKEQEKKLHDRIQEAIQKFNRDLGQKEQDIQFFEKENENLNRIITQQKMTINQLQNRVQKSIASQNEDELLKSLGLNSLVEDRNNEDTDQKQQSFKQFQIVNSMKEEKFMNKQPSQSKLHNFPTFREDAQIPQQLNQQKSQKSLFTQQNFNINNEINTWKCQEETPISDSESKIEKHELSNWSQDEQMIDKLQDQQQVSFSLQQQYFQREQAEGSEVQSDAEEFHIPLYQKNE